MNILCLDQFGELGGAQRCLLDLLPALVDRGWGVHVAAPEGPLAEMAIRLQTTADPIHCGPYSSGKKSLADMARFAVEVPRLADEIGKLVRQYDADLIYVNGPRLLPAAALAARNGLPVLFHSHSLLGGYVRRLAGRSLAMSRAAIVASCKFVAAPLLPYANGRTVRVVYNGVRQMPCSRRGANGVEFRIGAIGRISPEKGQADFLRAARILHDAMPHCRFVICGAPLFSDPAALRYSTEMQALAKDLPVDFPGWQENVEEVLGTLDLLVVPSAAIDATPRVIMEAFAAGVPVVAFASGGIPEIVEHQVTGFLVHQRSDKALACAMREGLRDPQRLREVADTARARARKEFSLQRYREQIIETTEATVSPRRR
jgi:glycosyltransferase involved in cell wall biosynthesis